MAITILQQAPSPSEARIRHTQQNVTVHITPASTAFQNPGTLYIADESLYFFSEASNSGFAIPYPSIIIHAIARESHVGPSIYCQLEGSLGSFGSAHTSTSTSNGNGASEEEEEEEDAVLELSFVPADVSSLDTIYENLSYCASLHQDDMDDEDMDGEGDYYEDDINDHDGLYADADIQGGYIPKSSSATAIGTSSSSGAQGEGEVEQVPAIDLQSGEWYTGNAETDAKFELSEHGQAALAKMENMLQDPHGLIPRPEDEEPGEDAEEDRFKDAHI
ncbi:regulator of volume decrease after cellular swelling-domain-containing protein [Linnemannia elongata]|nr:regulator of volume decrease after cellular swelling-domain-containing protein [Linnemannia elongata]